MKKNGFTLTEMIAVIAIIGVILLITIPVLNNMLTNNKEEKYMFYVETVEKAIYSYADLEYPMTVSGSQSITLNDLINNKYLKSFSEDGVIVNGATTFTLTKTNGKVDIASPNPFKLNFEKGGSVIATCSKSAC